MKLSVALCTYNGALYIEEQLLSNIHQDRVVDEIVICDDGSQDDTLNIACDIAEKFNTIRWNIIRNESNLGVVKNFEKAISLCTGDLIFLS